MASTMTTSGEEEVLLHNSRH